MNAPISNLIAACRKRFALLCLLCAAHVAAAQGLVGGVVFHDQNGDCAQDGQDLRLPDVIIELAGSTGRFYGSTDTMGNFSIEVPPGSYTLSTGLPGDYWQLCQPISVVTLDTPDVNVAVAMLSLVDCPQLYVDIAAGQLQACDTTLFAIAYRNRGPATADSAYLLVELPADFTYVSSSAPLTAQTGSVLRFNLPTLATGDANQLLVYARADCNLPPGATRCIEVHVLPDYACFPAPVGWDSAHIEAEAGCTGDSTFFRLRNVGAGAMGAAIPYIVVEDQIMYRQGWFQLPPGGDTTFYDPANGPTRVLLTRQSAEHPGNDQPVAAIEACGGPLTPGQVNRFPRNEADPFVAAHCLEAGPGPNSNTLDGYPAGLGADNRIPQGQDIDYLIRFRNTGLLPVHEILVRTELPPEVDPLTVQPGASSHPYQFAIERNVFGINELHFMVTANVLLPAGTDEAASRGFVQFSVAQRPDLPDGTVLEINTEIEFDGQLAAMPAAVQHTIGSVSWLSLLVSPNFNPGLRMPQARVVPNPVIDQAVIAVPGWEAFSLRLTLFDLQGRRLGPEYTGNGQILLEHGFLPAGVYLFQLANSDGQSVAGKVIIR